jgi:alpha-beta hydrolase superfamily lysophospholipase
MVKHSEGTIVGHAGMALFMQAWVPEQPRAVLALAHGLGEHSGRYSNLITELNRRGYAVYACDHRGHGRSPGQRGYIDSWQDFRLGVHALVEHTRAMHADLPIFLFGHSLGGLIVLDYVLHKSPALNGLVTSAPALSNTGISPLIVLASKLLTRFAPAFSLKTNLPVTGISRDLAIQQAYLTDALNSHVGTPRLATETFTTIDWVNAHAADLRVPLLMIHGEADPIVPAASSARFYAAAGSADKRRFSYPGVVHEPHNDLEWQQAISDVADWLDAHCIEETHDRL